MKALVLGLFLSLTVEAFAAEMLAPRFEGTYKLRFSCQPGTSFKFCETYQAYTLENTPLRMIVFNHEDYTSLVIVWGKDPKPFYHFTLTDMGTTPGEYNARSSDGFERSSPELTLAFDRNSTGFVKGTGWLRDTYFRADVRVEVVQTTQVAAHTGIKPGPTGISAAALIGDYAGTLGSPAGNTPFLLRIRRSAFDKEKVIASSFPTGPSTFQPIDFSASIIDRRVDGLVLLGKYDFTNRKPSTLEESKYALHFEESAQGEITLTGVAVYSDHPGYHKLKFKKR